MRAARARICARSPRAAWHRCRKSFIDKMRASGGTADAGDLKRVLPDWISCKSLRIKPLRHLHVNGC